MTAEVVPFPLDRRRQLVERCATRMLEQNAAAAENHLGQLIDVQRDVMRRRGVDAERVERQLRSFESAVRAEIAACQCRRGGIA